MGIFLAKYYEILVYYRYSEYVPIRRDYAKEY